MDFHIKKIPPESWAPLAEDAHLSVFGEKRSSELNKHSFVLGMFDSHHSLSGYVTCHEMDSETLYIQHGGVFPNYEKSIHVLNGYGKLILWCSEHYKRLTTKVENKNHRMLKLAWHLGFEVVGVTTFKNKIFCDLLLEYGC